MRLIFHNFPPCLEERNVAGDVAMVRSLPRSTWEASTKSFPQSAAAAPLCTYSVGWCHTTGDADLLLLPPGVSTSGGVIADADDTRKN